MAQYGQQIGNDWHLRIMQPVVWNDEGTYISLETLEGMTGEECAAFGVPRVSESIEAGATEGQVEISRKLIDVDGLPAWEVTYGDPGPVVLPPLPNITDRQFAYGLFGLGLISFDEAIAFTGNGAIPGMLQAMVDELPDDGAEGERTPRKDALMFLTGAKEYEYAHPLVDVLREKMGWSTEKLREEWTAWMAL